MGYKVQQKVNILVIGWRLVRLFVHFIIGLIYVMFFIRFADWQKKQAILQRWSVKCIAILGIQLVVKGVPPTFDQLKNVLLVSNHVSWLDILVIFTIMMPCFVAKKEISQWFVLGYLARLGNTIFVDRRLKCQVLRVNKQLACELVNGRCIAVFPEGTTSSGQQVLPFKSSLFDPIIQAKGKVLPMAIAYHDACGELTIRPAFVGDISFLKSVWRVLSCHRLSITVSLGTLINTLDYESRTSLAQAARQAIVDWLRDR